MACAQPRCRYDMTSTKCVDAGTFEGPNMSFHKHCRNTSEKRRTLMDETLVQMSIETISAKTTRQTFPVNVRNKNSMECVARNEKALLKGYEIDTFLQLREEELYLLQRKLNKFSTLVVSGLVFNPFTYIFTMIF